MKQCPNCKQSIGDYMTECPYCHQTIDNTNYNPYGSALNQNSFATQQSIDNYFNYNDVFATDPVSGKSRGVCAILAILLGGFGVQYFYLGKTTAGILSILFTLITCGLWEIIALIQGILMLIMDNRSFIKKYVVNPSKFPIF